MVKYSSSAVLERQMDKVFHCLSDATRRNILKQLAQRDSSVSELARPFRISLPAITKHLKVLEGAGLLVHEKNGRVRRCHLSAKPLKEASTWIEEYRRFWEERLDRLDEYLKKLQDQERKKKQ